MGRASELAQAIRRLPHFRTTALIALTGYGQQEDRDRARAAGFNAHLVKPVDVAKLLGAIDEFCRIASAPAA